MNSLLRFVPVLLLSGCASMMDGSTEIVHVNTNPINATCVVTDEDGGVVSTFMTPGNFAVVKTSDDMMLRCSKEGVGAAEILLPSGMDRWILGNVIFAGSTAVIDWGTGALNHYPDSIVLTLEPKVVVGEQVMVSGVSVAEK